MGRKRVVADRVLRILREAKRVGKPFLRFSEFNYKHKKLFGKNLRPSVLYANLVWLRNRGDVETEVDFNQGGLRGKPIWKLTDSYFQKQLKQEILNQLSQVSKIETELLGIAPALYFDTSLDTPKDWRKMPKTLKAAQTLAQVHFPTELSKMLKREFSQEEREKIIHLLGVLLYIGHKLQWLESVDPVRHESALIEEGIEVLGAKNLREVFDEYSTGEDKPYFVSDFGEAINLIDPKLKAEYGKEFFTGFHLAKLLPYSVPDLVGKEKAVQIKGTLKENIEFFNQNRELFIKFLRALKKMKFMILVYWGYPSIEKILELPVVDDFRKWREALIKGELDDCDEIFTELAKEVEKARRYLLKPKKKRKENEEHWFKLNMSHAPLPIGEWDGYSLYCNYDEAKTPEFWADLLKDIQERRKIRLRKNVST